MFLTLFETLFGSVHELAVARNRTLNNARPLPCSVPSVLAPTGPTQQILAVCGVQTACRPFHSS